MSTSNDEWKVASDGEDSENVPLWKALAQFTSEHLDDGLEMNATVISRCKPTFARGYNLAFCVSFGFGFFFILSLIAFLISANTKLFDFLALLTLISLAAAATPHLCRQAYQYGWKIPDSPLELPHEADRYFDEFLSYLQKASGPRAYYISRFRKRQKTLKRRQFFGRLRYFLFSEHSTDRDMVMRFPAALPIPADLYLHRDDVEKIIAMSKPKRKGGPGRNAKYRYSDAIIALIGDPRLRKLDTNDQATAIRAITNWLSEWFEANADASGDVPRDDLLLPYAKKIYARLKNLAFL